MPRETALRQFAKMKPCMVRLVGVCNWLPETTVLAHLRRPGIAGAGQKPPDTVAVWACSACHDVIDVRTRNLTLHEIDSDLLDALARQLAWYDEHEVLLVAV